MEEEGMIQKSFDDELKRKAENGNAEDKSSDCIEPPAKIPKCETAESSGKESTSFQPEQVPKTHNEVVADSVAIVAENEESSRDSKVEPNDDQGPGSKAEAAQNMALDPLGYTRAEEFTSEVFKIQIHNLPKFGYSDLKKRLKSLGLKPHKFKSPMPKVTYVCFRNEEDRQEAILKLNGHVWKGRTLDAKEAAPAADPFLQKRQQQKNNRSHAANSTVAIDAEPITPEEAHKRLKDNVIPLWNLDYTKQLETKTEKMLAVLKKMTHHHFLRGHFRQNESWKQDGLPCPVLPIIPSPVTSEYRNKNEFTIGYGTNGKTIKVGFRYGLYKDGTTTVGDCTKLGIVKPFAIPVVESFEKFVSESKWPPFLQQTGNGHWHTLTVRSLDSGDVMAMVDFHPRKLDKTEINSAKESVREYFSNGPGKDIGIKSFYFRLYGQGPEDVPKLDHIFGEPYVHETLLGLQFRISPEAFFQVNTKATEKLYSLIADWCDISEKSTVLDICCGTGTIGLSMAKRLKQVVGVEMCKSAVDDARENAALNDISNTRYYCSKVEHVIGQVLASVYYSSSSPSSSPPSSTQLTTSAMGSDSTQSTQSSALKVEEDSPSTDSSKQAAPSSDSSQPAPSSDSSQPAPSSDSSHPTPSSDSSPTPTSARDKEDIIAVVDPPRAGLHKSVIKSLRKSEAIERLVYVSCNPESAMENFVDLIRPSTGKLKGQPFTLVKAVPVDLFPGTRHCELVLLFTRRTLATS